jgi:dTDP-glucose 4,6-dehydratase
MPRLPEQDLEYVLTQASDVWPALKNKRIFLTGGTGFVGTWLLETLLHANDRLGLDVSIFVLTREPERFAASNAHLATHPAVTLVNGGIRTFDSPPGDFPIVIHAALPDPALDTDMEGTRRILKFAATHGTQRFLLTSSGAIYGKQPADLLRLPEDYAGAPSTTDPGTAYGHAKRAAEFLCTVSAQEYKFDALIARLFAFTGSRLPLDRNFAVGNFVGDVLAGGPIRIQGDGTPYRSYLYAADLAIWLWTILVHGRPFRPYNVGSGEAVSITELAGIVAAATAPGTPIEIAQKPVFGAPALRYVPCVERARVELGLRPVVALEEGVRRMYQWAKLAR